MASIEIGFMKTKECPVFRGCIEPLVKGSSSVAANTARPRLAIPRLDRIEGLYQSKSAKFGTCG